MAAESAPPEFVPIDPYALARREAASTQLKRFYKDVTIVEEPGHFAILLDGRSVKTPARADIRLPTRAAATLVADEWKRQGAFLKPDAMPHTKLVNTVIDGVARTMADVEAEIVTFAGSDLLCYRAGEPADLVALQAREWDPVLAWTRDDLQARFYLAEGIVFVAQPEATIRAFASAVATTVGQGDAAPFRLGALNVMTTLTGSALLALAIARKVLAPEEGWRKAHVDEDFQSSRWGIDAEAAERRERRWIDMRAAAQLIVAVG